jgi:hypothetical protein
MKRDENAREPLLSGQWMAGQRVYPWADLSGGCAAPGGRSGFAKRIVRKSARKATPRSIRKAVHPSGPQERDHATSGSQGITRHLHRDQPGPYAQLLGAHLLATLRETWAVAPSVQHARVGGALRVPTGVPFEVLFDIEAHCETGLWTDDLFG